MLAFRDIAHAVRSALAEASPRFLTVDEVLERLPMREQLIHQLGPGSGRDPVGARQAAASMVRDALSHIGAEVQFAFDRARVPQGEQTPEVINVVYRLTEAER